MIYQNRSIGLLSGNMLKVIAAVSMFIDHVGLMFFPDVQIFRILGRIAYPIFAFMIAEGCRYTKNKLRYFITIFLLAVVYQSVYYVFDKSLYMCVLVTFTFSILMIYAFSNFKERLFEKVGIFYKLKALIVFLITVVVTFVFNNFFDIDYGFWGCMAPVFASVFQSVKNTPDYLVEFDTIWVHVLMLGIGLAMLADVYSGVQYYSFFALPILMLYSGKRGRHNIKNFFYIFYPAHLALLQGIYMLIE